ncbi:MAG: hypothetical protein J0I15_07220 [Herbaspirillum huttiense]|uniref:hypothetical protein n=1 Tax=Herbaspirillum huttiense TaxID=863372 RepID=UPI001AD04D05|nr:hypothetical protein [Herbaspirillum huttiense]MBN9356220.1 hypothetical protein [Herbaspirillum huttiense]
MNAPGSLRHGSAHRKQAGYLRLALAKSQVWRIRISERVLFLLLPTGFKIPHGARVEEMKDRPPGGLILYVTTNPGTLMQFDQPLPAGVTAERIE